MFNLETLTGMPASCAKSLLLNGSCIAWTFSLAWPSLSFSFFSWLCIFPTELGELAVHLREGINQRWNVYHAGVGWRPPTRASHPAWPSTGWFIGE
jgi:hypothetical protein